MAMGPRGMSDEERQMRRNLRAAVLRHLEDKGWSLRELARRMGDKDKGRVARVVADLDKVVVVQQKLTLPLLVDLAKALGVPTLQLVAEVLNPPEQAAAIREEAEAEFERLMRQTYARLRARQLQGLRGPLAERIFSHVGLLAEQSPADVATVETMIRGFVSERLLESTPELFADRPRAALAEGVDTLRFTKFEAGGEEP